MLANCAYCQIWGNVKKQTQNTNRSKIIDSKTKEPIGNAKVRLPAKNFMVETDTNGEFDLNAQIKDKTIMSVEKRGYKPFSLTIDEHSKQQPFTIGIEKANLMILCLKQIFVILVTMCFLQTVQTLKTSM